MKQKKEAQNRRLAHFSSVVDVCVASLAALAGYEFDLHYAQKKKNDAGTWQSRHE